MVDEAIGTWRGRTKEEGGGHAENRIETYPWYPHLSTYRTPARKEYTEKSQKVGEKQRENEITETIFF